MSLEVQFLTNARRLKSLVKLFQSSTNTSYITHSEIIEGRADDTEHWNYYRRSLLSDELRSAIRKAKRHEGGVLVLTKGERMLGAAVLTYNHKHHYAILEDIVIHNDSRGKGMGKLLMESILANIRSQGLKNVVLESGIRNESAHAFFRKYGFKEAAIMFVKPLET